jgi:hypothetical protein
MIKISPPTPLRRARQGGSSQARSGEKIQEGEARTDLDSRTLLHYDSCKDNAMSLDKESLTNLICKHCDFYKESEKDLECGAYKILKRLLEKKILTPEEISDALRE